MLKKDALTGKTGKVRLKPSTTMAKAINTVHASQFSYYPKNKAYPWANTACYEQTLNGKRYIRVLPPAYSNKDAISYAHQAAV